MHCANCILLYLQKRQQQKNNRQGLDPELLEWSSDGEDTSQFYILSFLSLSLVSYYLLL